MSTQQLAAAVEGFAHKAVGLTDSDLERRFTWRYHDEEGLRFAFLGTYHELRDLATSTAVARAANGPPITLAQRVLGQYHLAYRDLQSLLLGVSDEEGGREPSAGQWPLRTVLFHIAEAERAFLGLICYAVERLRERPDSPLTEPDEVWVEDFCRDDADAFAALEHAPLSQVVAFYDDLHQRVIARLEGLDDAALGAFSLWWEGAEVMVIFRMQRMDAHMRQHTVQIEKTLDALRGSPSEARRLLRLIYAALAEAEAAALGAENTPCTEQWDTLAENIKERAQLLNG